MDDFRKKVAALSAGLDGLIAEGRGPSGRAKKVDTIRALKGKILAMRSAGWTWNGIAEDLKKLEFEVSPRTLRDILVEKNGKKKKKQRKGGALPEESPEGNPGTSLGGTAKKKRQSNASSKRQTNVPPRPPSLEAQSEPVAKQSVGKPATKSEFFTLKPEDL